MKRAIVAVTTFLLIASTLAVAGGGVAGGQTGGSAFQRIATYPVFMNNADPAAETVAEIVVPTTDGMGLVYTDSPGEQIGFVDITVPSEPMGTGTVGVGGEPTSVDVVDGYALAAVNTSESFTSPSGVLVVIEIATRTVVATYDLSGQPDSIKVSPDGRYVAVVVENERDEDLGDGAPPQLPGGALDVVDISGGVLAATVTTVDLTGIADVFPLDPEPEFVDVNEANLAAVTLQENNHIVVVNLVNGTIVSDFSAGSVALSDVDIVEDRLISFTGALPPLPREPDAVTWTDGGYLATANEGDLFGGTRGWTIFDPTTGAVLYDSGSEIDHLAGTYGHYNEERSENKGSEPEGIASGVFGGREKVFVSSERGSFVAVYDLAAADPSFRQFLPTGLGPEGTALIPERNLAVFSSEVDDPPTGVRSTIMIYEFAEGPAAIPEIMSADNGSGVPIGWGALSGGFASPTDPDRIWVVSDSFYAESYVFELNVGTAPAVIESRFAIPGDYDFEGVVRSPDGDWWFASEGGVSVDADDPTDFSFTENLIVHADPSGNAIEEIGLPADLAACRAAVASDTTLDRDLRRAHRFGFEGITYAGGYVWVAQQLGWPLADITVDGVDCADLATPEGYTNVWRYDPATGAWEQFSYELDPTPPAASWVGLSEIVALPDGRVAFIERDNRTGVYATVKTLTAVEPEAFADGMVSASEQTVYDLLPAMNATNGWISDKPETLAVTADGQVYVITDNDGVDDWSGETQLLRLGSVSNVFGAYTPPPAAATPPPNAPPPSGGPGISFTG